MKKVIDPRIIGTESMQAINAIDWLEFLVIKENCNAYLPFKMLSHFSNQIFVKKVIVALTLLSLSSLKSINRYLITAAHSYIVYNLYYE